MAIINKITGYTGYTVDTSGGLSDINGSTSKCLIAVILDHQSHDIDVEFSDNVDDWGISVGDNSIIPVFEPRVLYVNKNNCIVEFTLIQEYPSNSPCLLVYRSDTAEIRISESIESKPKVPNVIGGYFGFTIHNRQETLYHGLTNLMQISIKFPYQSNKVGIKISEGFDHWGISVGDGRKIIPVHSPNVLFVNKDNAVVQFELSEPYPSNSPCFLVYRTKEAYIQLLTDSETLKMVPVSDITNVNNFVFMNGYMNLSEAVVEPVNATNQYIEWTILSGPGIVENNTSLKGTGIGNIHLKATIQESDTKTFTKNFVIKSDKDIVTIESNLPNEVNLLLLTPPEVFYLKARSKYNLPLIYQWYKNTDNGFIEIDQRTEKFTTPTTTAGTVEYKCEIKTQYSDTVSSNLITVRVEEMIESIRFENPIDSLQINESHKFKILPETVDKNRIIWSTNDNSISSIEGGLLRVFGLGRIVVKAVYNSLFGYSREVTKEINITPYIQVTDVTNLITTIETNRDITLTATILPSEVSNREIEWVIVDRGSTNARLTGDVLRALDSGNIRMRCIVKKGLSQLSHYIKEFQINVNQAFVPLQSLQVEIPDEILAGKDYDLSYIIIPNNATNKVVTCRFAPDSVVQGRIESIANGIKVRFNSNGQAKLKFIIENGTSPNSNFELEKIINVNKQFVPVQNIINFTPNIEDVEEKQLLSGKVLPEDATNQNMTFRVVSAPSEFNARIVEGNKLQINTGLEWWRLNPSPKPDLTDKWIKINYDPIRLEITISDGLSRNNDYKKTVEIGYVQPSIPSTFINLEDVSFDLTNTNLDRSHIPIPFSILKFNPPNANNIDKCELSVKYNGIKTAKFYNLINVDNDSNPEAVLPVPVYQKYFKNDIIPKGSYILFNEPGNIELEIKVPKSIKSDNNVSDFIKQIPITIREPFIPTSIDQIDTLDIYYNEENKLFNFYYILKDYSIKNYLTLNDNKNILDISLSSSNLYYISSINPNENETISTIIHDYQYLVLNKNDINKTFKIAIGIVNGKMEKVSYIEKIPIENYLYYITCTIKNDPNIQKYQENDADYNINILINDVITPPTPDNTEPKFMGFELTGLNDTLRLEIRTSSQQVIIKTGDEVKPFLEQYNLGHYLNKKELYLMKLKLKDNRIIKIKWLNEISLLSNRYNEEYEIVIKNERFKKKDIIEIEFWKDDTILTTPTSLKMFGCNFTSLKKISNIPNSITGNECLAYFLCGCRSFNQNITIPSSALRGDRALFGFMEKCTSFNSDIIFEGNTAEGDWIMGRFLHDCTSFNKTLILPSESISGSFALYRFMANNTSFNSTLTLPKKIKGFKCFELGLYKCINFNKNLIIPEVGENSNYCFHGFMCDCNNFVSTIQFSFDIEENYFNSRTFTSYLNTANMVRNGITLSGSKAEEVKSFLINNLDDIPYRNIKRN